MSWIWLNVPLMALFSLATAGIPMWLVLRRPEPEPVPVPVPARYEAPRAERELVGASGR